jgi:hypothetical protein
MDEKYSSVKETDGAAYNTHRFHGIEATEVHEQPGLARHELPGTVRVGAYHEYYHSGRWNDTDEPLNQAGGIDWIGDDEWLAFDVDIETAGSYELTLTVAGSEQFGNGDIGIVVDDTPQCRIQFDATGGWYTWDNVTTSITLPEGLHTIRLIAFDGGWKLRKLGFSQPQ